MGAASVGEGGAELKGDVSVDKKSTGKSVLERGEGELRGELEAAAFS